MKKHTIFLFLSIVPIITFCQKEKATYHQYLKGTYESIEFTLIPGGTFTMGSPKTSKYKSADEVPQHQVTISSFWMATRETTWDLYQLFMERKIDKFQSDDPVGTEVDLKVDAISRATTPYLDMSFGMGKEGYPAICMTQLAAVKFCEWLSAVTGYFYRLPTEAEWEYACRAGTTTAYSFGNDINEIDHYAWYAGNSDDHYHKVGQKKPNPWGLYDMHGNVAEWTLDQYKATAYKTRKRKTNINPFEIPESTYPRTVRGGAWNDEVVYLRSAARRPSSKDWKKRDPQIPKSQWWHTDAPFVGFRIIRPVDTPAKEEQKLYWNSRTLK